GVAPGAGCCLRAITAFATVDIADQHPAFAIHGHIKEVEQVATDVGPALGPDATALQRRVWSCVRSRPRLTAVESIGDIQMPFTIEGWQQRISRCGRAIEGDGCAARVAGNGRRVPD